MSEHGARRGPPPGNVNEMFTLKVDNLTYRTGPDEVKPVFEKYGEIGKCATPLQACCHRTLQPATRLLTPLH